VNLSRCAYYSQLKSAGDSMMILLLKPIIDKHLRWEFLSVFIKLGN